MVYQEGRQRLTELFTDFIDPYAPEEPIPQAKKPTDASDDDDEEEEDTGPTGPDLDEVQAAVQEVYEDAVAAALADGAISEALAAELLEKEVGLDGFGPCNGRRGRRGGAGGPGGFFGPGNPNNGDTIDTLNA